MYLKIMISISIAALAVALFVNTNANYRVILQFLVCASAALIVLHAVRGNVQYLWAGAFLGVAVLFNPIFPIALSNSVFFFLNLICIGAFAGYYTVYQSKPRAAMASITD
jgi:hypothetical protein